MPGGGPGSLIEHAPGPELDDGGRDQQHRRQDLHRNAQGQVHQRHHRQADRQRDLPAHSQIVDLPLTLERVLVDLLGALGGGGWPASSGSSERANLVARLLDSRGECLHVNERRVEHYMRLLSSQIDVRLANAIHPGQTFFDAAHAARASHAFDRQDHLPGCRCWRGRVGWGG